MNTELETAIFRSWEFDPFLLSTLVLVTACYLRGWFIYRRRGSDRFQRSELCYFLAGMLLLVVALFSPLDVFGQFSLQIHMVQHLLLMIGAPPLILLGCPQLPILVGLPQRFRKDWILPFARWKAFRKCLALLFHPVTTWILFVATLWVWHAPTMYEYALESRVWHRCEHAMFLMTSVMFWYPVIQPYPWRTTGSKWWLVPYLLFAAIQGTALAGLISFSDQVLYPHYLITPNLWGISPITDQAIAGAIMWIPMSLVLLAALLVIIGQQLTGSSHRRVESFNRPKRKVSQFVPIQQRLPEKQEAWFACLLRPRPVRKVLQMFLCLLALLVVIDGLSGPQVSSLNLAGVLPWIHWRGLLILSLLVGGNFFCMVCPLTLARSLARRVGNPVRRWPKWLQNKWPAIGLLILFFWSYELFALWDRPFWTAIIVISIFLVAFAFDTLFLNAPFCQYLCPIGQFNFVQSLVSPSEVTTLSSSTCETCRNKECLTGSHTINGCQSLLFLPQKSGNMNCTFCLDCADACPHDNIKLITVSRGHELSINPKRSQIGSYAERPDLAALFIFLLFAALINAAWMTAPGIEFEQSVTQAFGVFRSVTVTFGIVIGLILMPALLTFAVACWSDLSSDRKTGWRKNLCRFAPALIPLGFGMWLAHYSFHLLTNGDTLISVSTRMISDWLGYQYSIPPTVCPCQQASFSGWILPLELTFLDCGLLFSLSIAYRIARAETELLSKALIVLFPWSLLLTSVYLACFWVLLQPMQMRGMLESGL